MLSGESATGKYPIEAVKVMDSIIGAAETKLAKRNPSDYSKLYIFKKLFKIPKNWG